MRGKKEGTRPSPNPRSLILEAPSVGVLEQKREKSEEPQKRYMATVNTISMSGGLGLFFPPNMVNPL